jgi:PASTA domain
MLRKCFLLALTCVLVLALAGCGGSQKSTGSTSSTTSSSPKTPASNISTKSGEGPLPQTEQVTVPDEVGFGMTTARMNLAESHLTFELKTEPPGADLPMDNTVVVISQTPAPGTKVDSGSTVTLVVKKK